MMSIIYSIYNIVYIVYSIVYILYTIYIIYTIITYNELVTELPPEVQKMAPIIEPPARFFWGGII